MRIPNLIWQTTRSDQRSLSRIYDNDEALGCSVWLFQRKISTTAIAGFFTQKNKRGCQHDGESGGKTTIILRQTQSNQYENMLMIFNKC